MTTTKTVQETFNLYNDPKLPNNPGFPAQAPYLQVYFLVAAPYYAEKENKPPMLARQYRRQFRDFRQNFSKPIWKN